MRSVERTSSIEAKRNSVTSCSTVTFIPGGIVFCISARAAFTLVAISVALEPAICCTIPRTDGWLLFFIDTEYCRPPNLMSATSRR